jgi:outer membrane lipoprotein SlyB
MSENAQSWTSTGISMAPMLGGAIGSAIAPGIGTAIGTVAGAVISLIGSAVVAVIDAATVTEDEMNQIRQDMKKTTDKIQEKLDGLETIESNEARLIELAKGVD